MVRITSYYSCDLFFFVFFGLRLVFSKFFWSSTVFQKGAPPLFPNSGSAPGHAIEQYFAVLKESLEKYDLMDKPGQIYNFDEVGVPLDHRPPHVIVKKGQIKVRYRSSGNKNQVTVVACVNTIGSAVPPYVIFDANMDWTEGEIPGTTYGLSSNGWIDMELFCLWFTKHFLQHAVSAKPLLLLMDGHSSHYSPETIMIMMLSFSHSNFIPLIKCSHLVWLSSHHSKHTGKIRCVPRLSTKVF